MSISPEEIASALTVNGVEITPFTQAWATADGQACAQGTEGAKPVLTANYDKESIDALKEIHGEDLDILSFDEPENFVDYAKAEGLITEGTELKKIGLAVYVDKTRATQFCDAIASLIESKKENAVVYLKVAENKEGYLKIRNYSKPSKA
jgi:hypothetical protein